MAEPKPEPTEKQRKQFENFRDSILTTNTIVESINTVISRADDNPLDDYTNMIVCLEIIRTMVITSATASKSVINRRTDQFTETNLSAEATRIGHASTEMIDTASTNIQALITRFEKALSQLRDSEA